MGASPIPKSVDFRAFAVNLKTIAPIQRLYQSGHAIWYYDMLIIMYSFLDQYDLAGKTVVPFATSGASGFSDSINTIKGMEPDADVVMDGLSILRDVVRDSEADNIEWLTEKGFVSVNCHTRAT